MSTNYNRNPYNPLKPRPEKNFLYYQVKPMDNYEWESTAIPAKNYKDGGIRFGSSYPDDSPLNDFVNNSKIQAIPETKFQYKYALGRGNPGMATANDLYTK